MVPSNYDFKTASYDVKSDGFRFRENSKNSGFKLIVAYYLALFIHASNYASTFT